MGETLQPLLEALKATAVALKHGGIPFALAGGFAVYARGGQDSRHDVDFVVREEDADAARKALADAAFDVIEPPEDWLFKAERDGAPVDLIFRLASGPVDGGLLARAETMPVESVEMPVLSATDLLVAKLASLSDHSCDLAPVLALVRSLREQVDVAQVREATAGHPFAEAALFLAARLGVLDDGARTTEEGPMGEEYHLWHVEQRLAEDDRTSELGVHLRRVGDRLHVTGQVASEAGRSRVLEVVRQECPGVEVVDELTCTDRTLGERPEGSEVIR